MDATEAAAVLARARQGDSDAFRALVEQHSRSVFRLAFRMTGNEQDAEDVVQESFLRAYRAAGTVRVAGQFRHLALSHRLQLLGGSDAVEAGAARPGARRQPRRGAMELPAADVPGPERHGAERGNRPARAATRCASSARSSAPRSRCGTTKDDRSTKSARRSGSGTSAAKHSVFRAVKKLRVALAPLRSQES